MLILRTGCCDCGGLCTVFEYAGSGAEVRGERYQLLSQIVPSQELTILDIDCSTDLLPTPRHAMGRRYLTNGGPSEKQTWCTATILAILQTSVPDLHHQSVLLAFSTTVLLSLVCLTESPEQQYRCTISPAISVQGSSRCPPTSRTLRPWFRLVHFFSWFADATCAIGDFS